MKTKLNGNNTHLLVVLLYELYEVTENLVPTE